MYIPRPAKLLSPLITDGTTIAKNGDSIDQWRQLSIEHVLAWVPVPWAFDATVVPQLTVPTAKFLRNCRGLTSAGAHSFIIASLKPFILMLAYTQNRTDISGTRGNDINRSGAQCAHNRHRFGIF